MNNCQSCGCSPCTCQPAALANPIITGGVFSGAVINGPTINSGIVNDAELVHVHIDLQSTGTTAAPLVCDEGIATNAYVCTAIDFAISGLNPDFCAAVGSCLTANAAAVCPAVSVCINTTPGIINSTDAFGLFSHASTTVFGVTRFGTLSELNAGTCLLSIDPCALIQAWTTPNLASPFWIAFANAVGLAAGTGGPAFCAAVFACGAAPLASPVFSGIPTVPTAAPGTANLQAASTAFVTAAITAAISASNPAFCSAVSTCGGGGGGGGGPCPSYAPATSPPGSTVRFFADNCQSYTAQQLVGYGQGNVSGRLVGAPFLSNSGRGCSVTGGFPGGNPLTGVVTFAVPMPDNTYTVVGSFEVTMSTPGPDVWTFVVERGSKSVNGFTFMITQSGLFSYEYLQFAVIP